MFAGETNAKDKAEAVASWFADFSAFRSHGRWVGPDEAKAQGLKIIDLEAGNELQDLVLSVHHAVRHTFNGTGTTTLIENHHGRAYLEMLQTVMMQQGPPPQDPSPMQLPGQQPPRQNRQARRHPNR